MKKELKKYRFEFYFYYNHALNYSKYFEKKMRLPIWNEDQPEEAVTAEFLCFEKKNDKVVGSMNVLIDKDKDLVSYESRKFLMNHPDDLVGHIILL